MLGDVSEPPHWRAVAAVAAGGVLGAEARYGVTRLVRHPAPSWPWATLLINVTGSALLGALMAVLLASRAPHPLVRPLLGVGVLGGFTTFSAFSLDAYTLLRAHRVAAALGYAAASVLGCVLACGLAGELAGRIARHVRARS